MSILADRLRLNIVVHSDGSHARAVGSEIGRRLLSFLLCLEQRYGGDACCLQLCRHAFAHTFDDPVVSLGAIFGLRLPSVA